MNTPLSRIAALMVLAFCSHAAQAALIPVTIDLTPSSGPDGSGSFTWDNTSGSVANLVINLDPIGPFPGGPNNPPVNLGAGAFNGSTFTGDVVLVYSPYFDLILRSDGTYEDNNGRFAGTYATTLAVPEPASLALLGMGLMGLALRRRNAARA